MNDQLRATVALALQAARSSSLEVELIKVADADAEVSRLAAWLIGTPEDLRAGARELAARQLERRLGHEAGFWALYFELGLEGRPGPAELETVTAPSPPASPPAPPAATRRLRGGGDPATLEARAARLGELWPLAQRLMVETPGGWDAVIRQLGELGVAATTNTLNTIEAAGEGRSVNYVLSEENIEQLSSGLGLLIEALDSPAPPPEANIPLWTRAPEPARVRVLAPSEPDAAPPAGPSSVPTTRKGRLRYVREKLKREGSVNINELSSELHLANVGTASELMKELIPEVKHVGHGTWKRA